MTTSAGKDFSIGLEWQASVMANSSRDPYWQGSVRRETIDHPESKAAIEDECSICHMPITRYEAKLRGQNGEVFSHLPFDPDEETKRTSRGRRDLLGVPPDRGEATGNTRELRRELRASILRWPRTAIPNTGRTRSSPARCM